MTNMCPICKESECVDLVEINYQRPKLNYALCKGVCGEFASAKHVELNRIENKSFIAKESKFKAKKDIPQVMVIGDGLSPIVHKSILDSLHKMDIELIAAPERSLIAINGLIHDKMEDYSDSIEDLMDIDIAGGFPLIDEKIFKPKVLGKQKNRSRGHGKKRKSWDSPYKF